MIVDIFAFGNSMSAIRSHWKESVLFTTGTVGSIQKTKSVGANPTGPEESFISLIFISKIS